MPKSGGTALRWTASFEHADRVAARLVVGFELDEVAFLRLQQEVVERAEAVIRFVEARLAALQRLLDHRAPDLFLGAAFVGQRFDRFDDEVERFFELTTNFFPVKISF